MRAARLGFTIIELLVVLVILALFTSMVIISIGDNSVRQMRAEAERFQSLVIAAADEAVFSSSQLGFLLETDGYQVLRLDPLTGRWQATGNTVFTAHRVPDSMTLNWNIEGFWRVADSYQSALQIDEDFFGAAEELEDAYADSDGSNADPLVALTPHILVLDSGELTAFTLEFGPAEGLESEIAMQVVSDGFSMPVVERVEL